MAWTTRQVYIDQETSEVLTREKVEQLNYEIKSKEKLFTKLTETHNESIIIYKCGPRAQQRLF